MAKTRTSAPAKSNKWFYSSNPFYRAGYGLPNCTAWAWGCTAENIGKAPKLSTGNAENWYGHTSDGYKRGKTPKKNAVIVWAKGKVGNSSDGAGHVAKVVEVYSDGSFLVSESGWKSASICWTKKIPASCKRDGYTFLGFIYTPDCTDEKKSVPKSSYMAGSTYTVVATSGVNVRKGPGTNYAIKQVKEMSADGKTHCTKSSGYATLKKGTRVTCVSVKGDWMQIPSGWICCKQGSDVYVK